MLTNHRTLEANLDSQVVSPRVSRTELLKFIHRPQLQQLFYPKLVPRSYDSSCLPEYQQLKILSSLYYDYDIGQDPYFMSLVDPEKRQKLLMTRKTYCSDQLKSLHRNAETIYKELGTSASYWYITTCVSRFLDSFDARGAEARNILTDEVIHLGSILGQLRLYISGTQTEPSNTGDARNYSPKVENLIQMLNTEWSSTFTGIIFAEQRVVVQALVQIIATHPDTAEKYRIESFVGMSTHEARKKLVSDLSEPRRQINALDDFRAGKINLLVATSALEEGIDIPQCHIVICFDKPKTLKAYIQRRGRARMKESKYIMMLPIGESGKQKDWKQLEDQIEIAYLDQQREAKKALQLEIEPEHVQREFKTSK
jgi:hypothetical protein